MQKLIESEKIELKSSLAESAKIIETISAFANVRGGEIYIGIKPNGEVIGISIGKNTIENLAADIKRQTDPAVFPNIDLVEIEGKNVIRISVKEYPVKPVFAKDKVFIRVGKSNQKATAEEIRRLFKVHNLKKWDFLTNDIDFEEISSDSVNYFVERLERESGIRFEGSLKPVSILERFELAQKNKLTNASILLFAKNPQKHFFSSLVKCAKFKGNKPIDFEDFLDIEGNLLQQIPAMLNFIKKHLKVGITISGKPERDEIWEIPQEALREAVINAVCHRDYESSANVQVRIFDDRLEIWNPGLLPPEISIEQLKHEHPSIPRNELIAKTFYRVRLIENWGTGTNRIIRMCKEANVKTPLFEEKSGSFVVTFFKELKTKSDLFVNFSKTQKAIIEYLKRVGEASTSELAAELNVDTRTIQRNTKNMDEILIWTGNSLKDPTGKYKLKRDK